MRIRTGIAAAALTALTLTACGGGEKALENAIEDATGGEADVDLDGDGSVSISTPDGEYNSGGAAALPDDFPSEIPLPEGDVELVATYKEANGWFLTYSAPSVTDGYCEAYFDGFVAAGFTEVNRFASAGTLAGGFANSEYEVTATCGAAAMGLALQVTATGG
jgi:hypothetical protein